ncbi:MAG: hypothetical protein CMH57_07650 [Myxococcales bacterium]|nr:hypothetical protein [Myxococcales bacterium]
MSTAKSSRAPAYRLMEELDELKLAQQPVYNDPTEHVREELQRLALWIELRGLLLKKEGVIEEGNRFRGMLLREGEMEQLLKRTTTRRPASADSDPEIARKHHAFEAATRRISLREAATLWSVSKDAGGCRLPLVEMSHQFGLDRFQYHVLILGLAPEVDLSFQRMFSYLMNDVTRKRPNVSLALELFGGDAVGRRAGRASFLPGSPLLEFNLIELDRGSAGLEPSLMLRDFKMPERVVLWLLGNDALAPQMGRYTQLLPGDPDTDALVYPKPILRRLGALRSHLERLNQGGEAAGAPMVVLTGPDGVGKRSVARQLAASVGRGAIQVDLEAAAVPSAARDRVFKNILREARLHDRALILANYSSELVQAGICPSLGYLYSILRQAPGLGCLTSRTHDVGLGPSGRGFSTRIALEVPDTFGRLDLWRVLIERGPVKVDEEVDLRGFSLKYGFTGGGIRQVLAHAQEEATMRTGVNSTPVTTDDLEAACRIQLGQGMTGIATRVRAKATIDEMVLPDDLLEVIQEIIEQARYRNIVFHDWGFDRKLKSGKGLSCLFSGPPGTGKTMVAGVIASELNMELFKVDLSQVVSKYVGETEKNLSKVFESAQGNQFIILFDEADSLFAKRTEVKSSVDRYANLEVNYLLQKIEDYGGMCVLTTNFEKGIDDAFKRRLNFRVDFPFPEPEYREELWRKLLPDEAPREDDIAYDWLAEKYELAGGNIRNAILRAAFWAAAKARPITTEDLELAAEKEAREIGKLVQGVGF